MYMKRVIIESPYAARNVGLQARYVDYARRAVAHSIAQGEAPIAFHILYTQPNVLNDDDPKQRALGMATAQQWYEVADLVAVYQDMGVSVGMKTGIAFAERLGLRVERRTILAPGSV